MSHEVKEAIVCKDRTGYWHALDRKTGDRVDGRLHNTELEAYKATAWNGYLVNG